MRRISLEDLTSSMKLAKSIHHNGKLILAEGTDNLTEYSKRLNEYGIFSVYIEDGISTDIEVLDAVQAETRCKCKDILNNCFNVILNQGNVEKSLIDDMVQSILNDLLNREDIIVSMTDIGTKDDATLIHSVNTAVFSVLTGKRMNLDEQELRDLAEGALFHDLGKVMINSNILLKNYKLTEDEFESMKEHPTLGYELLSNHTTMSEESKKIALEHHERLDGSGYPKGLRGDEISTLSKIVAIADVYDALTAERCYRKSMSNFKAYTILKQDVNVKYDTYIFKKFMENIAIYPNGIVVNLSDGTHGIVKEQNKDAPFRPVVRVIDDRDKNNIKLYDLNLMKKFGTDIID